MKAVILSAGQGRRLLPLTLHMPKCALPVAGRPIVEWQVRTLLAAGIDEIVVVVGHGAKEVERLLSDYSPRVRTLYNPFHTVSDNLASCWVAREELDGELLLVNGDTLFEVDVVRRLMESPHAITVTVDRKRAYDEDDMKVHTAGERLLRIGKRLPASESDAEAIGMIQFRDSGADTFRSALDDSMRRQDALRLWYLSVIDRLAANGIVTVRSIEGLRWAEVDTLQDLENARVVVEQRPFRIVKSD